METFIVFGSIVTIFFISRYFRALEKGVAKPISLSWGKADEIEALRRERAQLEERVRNLESIVCAVDLEVNARLNRIAASQSLLLPAAQQATLPPAAPAAASRAPSGVVPGHQLCGRYTIERELGRGGMGAVFLARDAQLGELVALKLIARHLADDPSSVERFRREVSAARKITHANVIRIHDLGETDGLLFLSMEYFPGLTLADILGRRGALPLEEAGELLAQVVAGLAAAHAAGVVHRDLKPQNVLVGERRHVKIIDFGLAKASFLDGMTATGLILGTPEYMAPEQIRGQPVDARTDVYALGALAYHVYTGSPPFRGDFPIAVGFAHCTQAPRPPRELRPDLPEPVERAILAALEKVPGARPVDPDAFFRGMR